MLPRARCWCMVALLRQQQLLQQAGLCTQRVEQLRLRIACLLLQLLLCQQPGGARLLLGAGGLAAGQERLDVGSLQAERRMGGVSSGRGQAAADGQPWQPLSPAPEGRAGCLESLRGSVPPSVWHAAR